jgi:hypothetical protein
LFKRSIKFYLKENFFQALVLGFVLFFVSGATAGSNNGLVYHGRIVAPNGAAVNSGTAIFSLQVYGSSTRYWDGSALQTGNTRCLLYQETHSKNMSGSLGAFELILGEGTGAVWGVGATAADQRISKLFVNNPLDTGNYIKAVSCTQGNTFYFPSGPDVTAPEWVDRELVVTITVNGTSFTLSPVAIKAQPYAMQAQQVGGFSPQNLFRIDGTSNLKFSAAQHDYLANSVSQDGSIMRLFGLPAVPVSATEATSKAYVDAQIATAISGGGGGGGGGVATVTGTAPIQSSGGANPAISISQASSTIPGYLAAADWVTFNNKLGTATQFAGEVSGPYNNIVINAGVITTAKISDAAVTFAKLQNVTGPALIGRGAAGAGSVSEISVGAGLALSVGGVLTATNTGSVTSVGGTAPIESSGGATPMISISQASNLIPGYLSAADWVTFNNKLSAITGSGLILISNGNAVSISMASQTLAGRFNAGIGAAEQISIGSGLSLDGAGVLTATLSAAGVSGAGGYVQGGNAFGVDATIGTIDNRPLSILTNNTPAMTISQSGNVGFGTVAPETKLEVVGGFSSVGTGLNSQVMGIGASAQGVSSVVIGNYASDVSGATIQANSVVIGTNARTMPSGNTGGLNVVIGANALAPGHRNVIVGANAGWNTNSSSFGNVIIGDNATTTSGWRNVVIGRDATSVDQLGVTIGNAAEGGGCRQIVIGNGATAATGSCPRNIVVGDSARASSDSSIVMGANALSPHGSTVVLGRNAASTHWYQFIAGSESYPIKNMYLGKGVSSPAADAIALNGTSGLGTDIPGGDVSLVGGRGTGSASGGSIYLRTAAPGATGTVANVADIRMTITGLGNVGIGATNPSYPLDVRGVIQASGTSIAAGQVQLSEQNTNAGNNFVAFRAAANLSTDTTFVWPSNGGDANQVLTTDGAGNLSWAAGGAGSVTAQAVSDAGGYVQGGNAFGANAVLGTLDNRPLSFIANNSTAVTISQSGDMGIGTATPNAKLDVQGTVVVPRADNGGYFSVYHSGSTVPIAGLSSANHIVLGAPLSNTNSRVRLAGSTGDISLEANNRNIIFANGVTGAENARILGSGLFGMGVTNPSYPLDVRGTIQSAGTSAAPGQIQLSEQNTNAGNNFIAFRAAASLSTDTTFVWPSNGGSANQVLTTDGTGNLSWAAGGGGGVTAQAISDAGGWLNGGNAFGVNASLGTTDNRPLSILTNNSPAMTISQNGYIGIGTASPTYPLVVTPTAGYAAQFNGNGIWVGSNTAYEHSRIYAAGGSGYHVTSVFSTANTAVLDLGRWNGNQLAYMSGIGSNGDLVFSIDANNDSTDRGFYITKDGGGPSAVNLASGALLSVMESGNVGIGTTNPGKKLEIVDSPSILPLKISPSSWSASDYTGIAFAPNGVEKAGIFFRESDSYTSWNRGDLIFALDAAPDAGPVAVTDEKMRISTDGNVGIGATNPSYPLDVRGTIQSSGNATGAGQIQLSEQNTNAGNNFIALRAPADLSGDTTFVWPSNGGSANQVLTTDGAGNLSWAAGGGSVTAQAVSDAGGFLNGGNAFGANAVLGTNDNYKLSFKANNTTAMSISQNSNISIGTVDAFASLTFPPSFPGMSTGIGWRKMDGTPGTSLQNLDNMTLLMGPQAQSMYIYSGNVGAVTAIILNGNHPSNGGIIEGWGANGGTRALTIRSGVGADMMVGSNGTERIRILSAGNVGIGNTAPGTSLDVSGIIRARAMGSVAGQIQLQDLAASSTFNTILKSHDTLSADRTFVFPAGYGDANQVLTTDGAGNLSWGSPGGASGFVNGGNAFGVNASLGTTDNRPLSILTNNSPAVTISQNGFVGIGTTSPDAKLDVEGSIATNNGVAIRIQNTNAANTNMWMLGTGGGVAGPGDFTIGDSTNYRMTINSSGFVGIGTTNPQAVLDVAGAARVGSATNYSEFGNNGTTNYWKSTVDPLGIFAGGSERIRVAIDGSVGIGTTAPNATLHVGADNTPSTVYLSGSSSGVNPLSTSRPTNNNAQLIIGRTGGAEDTGGIEFITSPAGAGYGWKMTAPDQTSPDLRFLRRNNSAVWSEAMRIQNSTGNVGIGTLTPNANLHIATASGSTASIVQATTGNYAYHRYYSGSAFWDLATKDDEYFGAYQFRANGGIPQMVIQTGGNVGIGTTSPTTALTVSGAIVTPTVNNAAGVADINFLSSLTQVSANTTNNQAFRLCGLQDGGSYTLILKGQPIGSTPTFTVFSDAACSTSITNFDAGGVTLTTTSATTILTFVRAGSTVYAMIATGFTQ